MSEENQSKPEHSVAKPVLDRVIQPSESFIKEIENQKQQATPVPTTSINSINAQSADSVYPEATKSFNQDGLNPAQSFALASSEIRTKENNKPVCLRVKSLFVIAF